MNTPRFPILAAVLISVVLAVSIHAAESVSVLLQKAIFAEETEGNLEAAIKIYEGIVKDNDGNRSLVAQAQYRLGVCELKRGKKEDAVAAFRRLIDQFSDAAGLVARSRERLAELGRPASTVTDRNLLFHRWPRRYRSVGITTRKKLLPCCVTEDSPLGPPPRRPKGRILPDN